MSSFELSSNPALLALSSAQVEFRENAARYHMTINAPITTHIETNERMNISQL
jgi:hypothetical protein